MRHRPGGASTIQNTKYKNTKKVGQPKPLVLYPSDEAEYIEVSLLQWRLR
jgi:hypothetical protein